MEEIKLDLALYIMQLKITSTIKNNKEKDLDKFKQTLEKMLWEKEEIKKGNEEIIKKVYDEYLNEIKGEV